MKYSLWILISAIIIFLSGMKVGSIYFAKTEIKVVKETVHETVYKYKDLKPEAHPIFDLDNFNRLLACYDSPLKSEYNVVGNKLNIYVWDLCKETNIEYEIGTSGNYKIYLTVGVVGVLTGIGLYHYLK
jgi:hypothetical protein